MAQQSHIRMQKLVAHNANEVQSYMKDLNDWTSQMESKEQLDKNKAAAIEFKEEGNQFMKEKQYKEAIDKYSEGLHLDPSNAVLYSNRAQARLFLKQYSDVVADCTEALKLNVPTINEKATFRRAKAYFELGKYNLAKQDLLKTDPKNAEARQLLGLVNARTTQPLKRHQDMTGIHDMRSSGVDTRAGGDIPVYPRKILAIEKPPNMRSKRVILPVPIRVKGGGLLSRTNTSSTASGRLTSPLTPRTPSETAMDTKTLEAEIENMTTMDVPPKPSTAAQFSSSWKLIKNHPSICAQYLNQMQSQDYNIFQDSLELATLSDILTTLQWEFLPRKWPFEQHLEGLLRVKRLATLFMLMTEKDRATARNLISQCANPDVQNTYNTRFII